MFRDADGSYDVFSTEGPGRQRKQLAANRSRQKLVHDIKNALSTGAPDHQDLTAE
jgi:hypothetical protein